MNPTHWSCIAADITRATGKTFTVRRDNSVGGGCINAAHVLEDDGQRYFVKLNSATRLDMFAAEAQGLEEIVRTNTIRAPVPVCYGIAVDQAYLVLEFIALGHGGHASQEQFGQQLAALHRVTRPRYGWTRDNTIGATPQHNTECDDWVEFWRTQRLGFQLQLAADKGYCGRLQNQGERLLAELATLLVGHSPPAALLHGDLWSGNYSTDANGAPVIFDPAIYYGDRETDLAMTELFGGFSPRFYQAYNEAYPLPEGYRLRKSLYNLYHVLNHLNLFGGGYLAQAEQLLDRLLHELH
jgi:protein-ribulosamine 3-kinase